MSILKSIIKYLGPFALTFMFAGSIMFLYQKLSRKSGKEDHTAKDTTIIYRDTGTYHIDSIPKPVPYLIFQDTGRAYFREVDALSFLSKDSLVKLIALSRFYRDTIIDTNIRIYLEEAIRFNQVQDRKLSYNLLRPQNYIYQTKITPPPRSRIMPGAMAGGNASRFGFGPACLWNFRNNNAAAISYDAINKDFYLNYYFNLKQTQR